MSLSKIQAELKAPKNQFNGFGKYNYRSCEDILEGVKPLLSKYNSTLTLSDDIVQVSDRIYVKATATFKDSEGNETQTTAFARESEEKKGMDASQVTGSSSSYARKYALNGLFCIDDTKDADSTNTHDKRDTKCHPPVREKTFDEISNELKNAKTLQELSSIWQNYSKQIAKMPEPQIQSLTNTKDDKKKIMDKM